MTRRSDNGAVEKLSQFLTPQHLRQLKFAGVVTVMTLLCGIFLWYLFTPKPAPQQAGAGGYNVTIPEATVKPAETDKRKIYSTSSSGARNYNRWVMLWTTACL